MFLLYFDCFLCVKFYYTGLKYIATRETVEVREQNKFAENKEVTENQKQLLNDLLLDFPEAKRYLEYEDYTANPTVENASELISTIIERNADVIGNRQNFVGYMAMRPGVEKRGNHGLFNEKDEPIILDRWFCQYHLTHFIRTRIMQRERYDHSRAFFELPEAAHRWRCRFFC